MSWKHAGAAVAVLVGITSSPWQADAGSDPAYARAGKVSADTVVVYKRPTCACCSAWLEHVKERGFVVVAHDMEDLDATKRRLGVPADHVSCHTATVRGYTIEGHVPADLIRKVIEEQSRFRGLVVPGMPSGSPGMEGPMKQSYDVLAFDKQGETEVYAKR